MGAMHGKFFVRDARICGGGHSVPREGGGDRGLGLAWPNLAGGMVDYVLRTKKVWWVGGPASGEGVLN
jgi:hypothetical protein